MFFCNDCGATFENKMDLEDHVKINHENRKRTSKKNLVGHKTLLNHMTNHKVTKGRVQ